GREGRQQLAALEDVGDPLGPVAELGDLLDRKERLTAPARAAAGGGHQPAEHVQERGLAGARRAPERDRLADVEGEADAVEGAHLRAARRVRHHHRLELQQPVAHTTLLPSRISITRSAESATAFECVTTTTVTPCSDRRRSSASSTDCSFPASSSPVGSSASSSFASRAAAAAIATRCCSPPERAAG